jgi:hypothetical protein
MQGCTLRLTHAGREGGTICVGPLKGRTGELPADDGLGSSGRGPPAGRIRGQLAPPLDARRQSVILLTTHFLLKKSHYCYNSTPWTVSLGEPPGTGLAV